MKSQWLTKEYYISAQEKYNCFPQSLDALLAAVDEMNADQSLQELFRRLVAVMEHPDTWDDSLELPTPHHMLAAVAVCAFMPGMIEGMVEDGFPLDTACATAREMDLAIQEVRLSNKDKPGMSLDLVKWYRRYLKRDMFRMGRFNFERSHSFTGHVKVFRNKQGEEMAFSHMGDPGIVGLEDVLDDIPFGTGVRIVPPGIAVALPIIRIFRFT